MQHAACSGGGGVRHPSPNAVVPCVQACRPRLRAAVLTALLLRRSLVGHNKWAFGRTLCGRRQKKSLACCCRAESVLVALWIGCGWGPCGGARVSCFLFRVGRLLFAVRWHEVCVHLRGLHVLAMHRWRCSGQRSASASVRTIRAAGLGAHPRGTAVVCSHIAAGELRRCACTHVRACMHAHASRIALWRTRAGSAWCEHLG